MTTTPIDRLPPHSVEAEEALLGSILIDTEALDRVSFLADTDFYIIKHQWVWAALQALHARHEPIDAVTLRREVEARDQLDELGGPAYLTYLMTVVPTAIHAVGYGRIVERAANRRRLLRAASDIAQLAYDESADDELVNDRAEQLIFKARRANGGRETRPIAQVLTEYYARIEYLYEHRDEPLGVPTGLIDLDRLLSGLQKSDLDIIAARPGIGKTSLLLNIGLSAAQRFQQRVAIFSLEMSAEQIAERLVAQHAGIDSQRLRTGQLTDEDWPLFVQTTSGLSEAGVWIDDTAGLSSLQLRAKARRLHAAHGFDLILVDYLQLMTSERRSENRNQEVAALSQGLKNLARELNVPVLVASQLSRAVEQRSDKRPQLSDLRDSGSLEQDADVVMFLYRDAVYNPACETPNVTELIIAKHRKGPTGTVQLYWQKELT
ncbi:MAG: replicative DNA helicase, partial [Chloroflexi bacterium]|nr:replicative DNA helicase [Chloroflexota bacterium]